VQFDVRRPTRQIDPRVFTIAWQDRRQADGFVRSRLKVQVRPILSLSVVFRTTDAVASGF